jgi:hypothetical protein
MLIGMMWYEKDPKSTLKEKIEKALNFYQQKYGKCADTVAVSVKDSTKEIIESINIKGVTIILMKEVLTNCLWVGIRE